MRERNQRVTITVPAWVAALLDSGVRALLILLAAVFGGFAVIWFGWRGSARTFFVWQQVPFALSGGLIGIAVVGTALAVFGIQIGRREDARHRRDLDNLVGDVITQLDASRPAIVERARSHRTRSRP